MNEMYSVDISKHLSHYGREGMKWYQHIFGTDTRYGVNGRNTENERKPKASMLARIREHRAEVKQQKIDRKRRAEEAKRLAREIQEDETFLEKQGRKIHARSEEKARKIKDKAMRSGDPRTILRYMDVMDDDELKKAYNRADTVKKIKDLIPKEEKKKSKGQSFIDGLNATTKAFESVSKTYKDNRKNIIELLSILGIADPSKAPKDTGKIKLELDLDNGTVKKS